MEPLRRHELEGSEVRSAYNPIQSLSPTFTNRPRSPVRQRSTYTRLSSAMDERNTSYEAVKSGDDDGITAYHQRAGSDGLGISGLSGHDHERRPSVNRSFTVESQKPIMSDDRSPPSAAVYEMSPWAKTPRPSGKRRTSFQSSLYPTPSLADDDASIRRRSMAESLRHVYNEFQPHDTCAAKQHFHKKRTSGFYITVLVLSSFSTVFSCIYVILALRGPRYPWIRQGGTLSPDGANILTALFAKGIELSFATVFITFLGQILSRRAYSKSADRGVTLAQMDMRSWVMQPGTIFTHTHALRASILSWLGILSLVCALLATLYTTASQALVQPQLRSTPWEVKVFKGLVKTAYANAQYLQKQCNTPITYGMDPANYQLDCTDVVFPAQTFNNWAKYLSNFALWVNKTEGGSADPMKRPEGFALLYENTTVSAPWIDIVDVHNASALHNRIVNNVTMAVPHAGISVAARDPVNNILQPSDLLGQGLYSLRASVPSPAINVLCVSVNQSELDPLVWTQWPSRMGNDTVEQAEFQTAMVNVTGTQLYNNHTSLDDLFGWGEKYNNPPPVFAKYPIGYNTLINASTQVVGPWQLYILSNSSSSDPNLAINLCSMSAYLTPYCSTEFNVSGSGGAMSANCSTDRTMNTDIMQYIRSHPNATDSLQTSLNQTSPNWLAIAADWARSVSLNNGISDGAAASARVLTQMILTEPSLNATLPSIAESLAVYAGSTLLQAAADAPFTQSWNYTNTTILDVGEYQYFNSQISALEYASGGNGTRPVKAFHIVLLLLFFINLGVLAYLVVQPGMVTDFSEPLNLFSIAVNSPPSDAMAGSCGGGPKGGQMKVNWVVNVTGDHLYVENHHPNEGGEGGRGSGFLGRVQGLFGGQGGGRRRKGGVQYAEPH